MGRGAPFSMKYGGQGQLRWEGESGKSLEEGRRGNVGAECQAE